jgi:aconitate hydratase 2/2-methylisocitrate dehydratase
VDENGNPVRNENGDVVLEEAYSVATGTVLTINTKTKLYNGEKELKDISKAFTQKWNL